MPQAGGVVAFHGSFEVATPAGRAGIVHGDAAGADWSVFTAALEAATSKNQKRRLLNHALWSRDRIEGLDATPVAAVAVVFVGHSPVTAPSALGNVIYVDTGAAFVGGHLTVLGITRGLPGQLPAPESLPRSASRRAAAE